MIVEQIRSDLHDPSEDFDVGSIFSEARIHHMVTGAYPDWGRPTAESWKKWPQAAKARLVKIECDKLRRSIPKVTDEELGLCRRPDGEISGELDEGLIKEELAQYFSQNEKAIEADATRLNAGTKPKVVKLGLTVISIDEVDDKMNTFRVNFLFHVNWPAVVDYSNKNLENGIVFRPKIMFKNLTTIEEHENMGAYRYSDDEIRAMAEAAEKSGQEAPRIMHSYHYQATFAKQLAFHKFPFDCQELTIIVASDSTKDVILTGMSNESVKTNFEYEVLSEWSAPRDKTGLTQGTGLSYFLFTETDPKLSNAGETYNNLFFYIVVHRSAWPTFLTVILPSALLTTSSLVIYAQNPVTDIGGRFGVIFTILLTLAANQLSTNSRLPNVTYMTAVDKLLLTLQLFCYLLAIETAIAKFLVSLDVTASVETNLTTASDLTNECSDYYCVVGLQTDVGGFYVMLAILVLNFLLFGGWFVRLWLYRCRFVRAAQRWHDRSRYCVHGKEKSKCEKEWCKLGERCRPALEAAKKKKEEKAAAAREAAAKKEEENVAAASKEEKELKTKAEELAAALPPALSAKVEMFVSLLGPSAHDARASQIRTLNELSAYARTKGNDELARQMNDCSAALMRVEPGSANQPSR